MQILGIHGKGRPQRDAQIAIDLEFAVEARIDAFEQRVFSSCSSTSSAKDDGCTGGEDEKHGYRDSNPFDDAVHRGLSPVCICVGL